MEKQHDYLLFNKASLVLKYNPTHHNKYVPEGIRKDKENDKQS
ncbi:hypothetical protein [Symbiopectobacterium sp. RP]